MASRRCVKPPPLWCTLDAGVRCWNCIAGSPSYAAGLIIIIEIMFNKKQAAEVLGVSIRTISNMMARNEFEYVKMGKSVRFYPKTLQDYLSAHTVRSSKL